jgi:NitT/TauT family transport system substrate-binding protein
VTPRTPRAIGAALLLPALLLAACGAATRAAEVPTGDGGAPAGELRIGVFPNVTHAPGIVNVEDGHLEAAVGGGVDLTVQSFNAGPDVIGAILSGALDAAYVGPNPAINGYAQSNGEGLRIVAGATSGGAFLVTRSDLTSVDDLAGTTLSTPQLGNTQDIALRALLLEEGYETTLEGGGDVAIQPQANAQILETFLQGAIDGAWVPEPWATRMIEEGGGRVLVDERDLWEDGAFVTTHLVVRTAFLEQRPDLVRALLVGHLDAIEATTADPEAAKATVSAYIEDVTGAPVSPDILDRAWPNMTFTSDPIADSLRGSAADAQAAGVLGPVELDAIYDLELLNELLSERDQTEVSS